MTYAERQAASRCVYSSRCKRQLADGADLCDRHLKRKRRVQRTSAKEARDNNRTLGLCAFCPTKSATYRCAACAVKHGQTPSLRVASGVDAAPQSDQWRKDNDGWARYRGKGRRGAPAAGVNDEQDLRDAEKALEAGRKALAYARSPEVQALPRIQRASVRREATAFLAHAARFLDEVVERNEPKGRE